jgi:hypothetical protein
MLFDTIQPQINNYTAPQNPKFSGNEKKLMSILGYNDEGNRNTWGKIMPFVPGLGVAGTIGSNIFANHLASDNDEILREHIRAANKQKGMASIGGLEIGAGVAASALGAPQAGMPLITQGIGTSAQSFQMKEGGYIPGGSHKSGNDIALVHANTGEDTGIRVEGKELLFSKENTEELKEAIENNDHEKLFKIVESQLNNGKPQMDNEKMELGEGTNWSGIPNVQQYTNPYAFGDYFGKEQNGQPYGVYAPEQIDYSMAGMAGYTPSNAMLNRNYNDTPLPMQEGIDAVSSSTAPTNSMGNYWSYIPALAQTAIGLSNVNKKIPTIQEPAAYSNYVNRVEQMSHQGYTPEERAYIDRDIKSTYALGLDKAKSYSGGNSAAVLGTLNSLGNGMNEAKLKAKAEEAGLKRQNLLNYGSALGTETQLFNLPNQEWAMKYALMNKEAAANLANTGLTNVQGAATYNNLYNSPEFLALLQAYKNKAAQ